MKLGVILNPNALGVRRDARPRASGCARVVDGAGEVVATRTPAELRRRGAPLRRRRRRAGRDLRRRRHQPVDRHRAGARLRPRRGCPRSPSCAAARSTPSPQNLGIRGAPDEHPRAPRRRGARRRRADASGRICSRSTASTAFCSRRSWARASSRPTTAGSRPGVVSAALLDRAHDRLVARPGAHWRAGCSRRPRSTLTVDGERAADRGRTALLVASTVPDVGMGMRVPWQAGRAGRAASTSSPAACRPRRWRCSCTRVFAGRPLAGAPHLDRLASRVAHRASPRRRPTRSTAICSAPAEVSSSPSARACRSRAPSSC